MGVLTYMHHCFQNTVGAAPIQWAVIDGEKVSGVTTMQMDEGLDTGDMILKKEVILVKKRQVEACMTSLQKRVRRCV